MRKVLVWLCCGLLVVGLAACGSGGGGGGSSASPDSDKDGFTVAQGDCDDANANVFPGNVEWCDGLDNDCDEATAEGSGETPPAATLSAGVCLGAEKVCVDGAWADPDYALAFSGYEANELSCDGADNDCDGEIDEALTTRYYADTDGDDHGAADNFVDLCAAPASGYVENSDDCDDGNFDANPDATEVCDGFDNDCNELVDTDDAGLSLGLASMQQGVCVGALKACEAGVETEPDYADYAVTYLAVEDAVSCDTLDNDCDGVVDEGCVDDDNDGVSDTIDNCPGLSDPDQTDNDGDGFGAPCDEDGNIAGIVTDAGGAPLEGVLVVAIRLVDDVAVGFSTLTGADGSYAIVNLTPAQWDLEAAVGGYGFAPATATVTADEVSLADFAAAAAVATGDVSGSLNVIRQDQVPLALRLLHPVTLEPIPGLELLVDPVWDEVDEVYRWPFTLTGVATGNYWIAPAYELPGSDPAESDDSILYGTGVSAAETEQLARDEMVALDATVLPVAGLSYDVKDAVTGFSALVDPDTGLIALNWTDWNGEGYYTLEATGTDGVSVLLDSAIAKDSDSYTLDPVAAGLDGDKGYTLRLYARKNSGDFISASEPIRGEITTLP